MSALATEDTQHKNEAVAGSAASQEKVRLAVFDFDGTCINGNSPVMLVKYLSFKRMLDPVTVARILSWAFRYKFHLPQNETWVRQLVFTAFKGKPADEVHEFLRSFFDSHVNKNFREKADLKIQEHKAAGDYVVVLSASFEPMIQRAQELHDYDHQISVRMHIDEDGNYTNDVIGEPIEGKAKVRALFAFANEHFGEGNWELSYVYADHYSDIPLIEKARHPFAVNPGPSLKKEAKKRNWPILDWE